MWLAALDDLLRNADSGYLIRRNNDVEGQVILGLRLVRNAILHGDLVMKLAAKSPGAVLGRATLPFVLGSAPSCKWVGRGDLSLRQTPVPDAEASYDRNFAGQAIMVPLHRAFAYLRLQAGT
jgi:hypothetical protein